MRLCHCLSLGVSGNWGRTAPSPEELVTFLACLLACGYLDSPRKALPTKNHGTLECWPGHLECSGWLEMRRVGLSSQVSLWLGEGFVGPHEVWVAAYHPEQPRKRKLSQGLGHDHFQPLLLASKG